MKYDRWIEHEAEEEIRDELQSLQNRVLNAPGVLPRCRTCDRAVLNSGAMCIPCQIKRERDATDLC